MLCIPFEPRQKLLVRGTLAPMLTCLEGTDVRGMKVIGVISRSPLWAILGLEEDIAVSAPICPKLSRLQA